VFVYVQVRAAVRLDKEIPNTRASLDGFVASLLTICLLRKNGCYCQDFTKKHHIVVIETVRIWEYRGCFFLPIEQLYDFYRYNERITGIFVMSKPVVNSRFKERNNHPCRAVGSFYTPFNSIISIY
jgi:hypothetical protein